MSNKTNGPSAAYSAFLVRRRPVVQALGISSSLTLKLDDPPFQLTHSDLVRYRSRARSPLGQHRLASQSRTSKDGGIMTIAEACWIKWEEETGICRKLGYAFDEKGDAYKPDITYVQAIRLVIAASPRRMLTLSQIYDAIEERWPWHKTSGQTWKNSVRHNLSLNKCFVKVDRPTNDGGIKKGSYWTVDDSLSGQTARRTRKGASTTIITPRIEPPYVVPSRVSKEQATNTLASGGIFAWKSPHFVPHEVRRTSRGVEHTRPWHDVPFDR
nr:uncharacterized protein CI109_006580 [Kwoniella shandongensis]KAA5525118.1 hypothetical protein CI109_006580 [Kwoniella shandongensis]